MYYLKVLEVSSPKWISLVAKWLKSRCGRASFPLEVLKGIDFLAFPSVYRLSPSASNCITLTSTSVVTSPSL